LRPSTLNLFRERRTIPRVPFIHLTKCLVDEPPSRFSSGAPMEIDACLQSLFYLSFRVPIMGTLPPGSLHRAPIERDAAPTEPLSTISQSPRQMSPPQFVQLSPQEERCLPPEPSFHNLQGPQQRSPPPPGSPNRVPIERVAP